MNSWILFRGGEKLCLLGCFSCELRSALLMVKCLYFSLKSFIGIGLGAGAYVLSRCAVSISSFLVAYTSWGLYLSNRPCVGHGQSSSNYSRCAGSFARASCIEMVKLEQLKLCQVWKESNMMSLSQQSPSWLLEMPSLRMIGCKQNTEGSAVFTNTL